MGIRLPCVITSYSIHYTKLYELIKDLHGALRPTVFMVTHDLDSLHAICDRVAVLAGGRICAIGTLEEILAVDEPWIAQYFGGPRGRAATASRTSASEGNA